MNTFTIDCAEMVTKENAHQYLSDSLNFPDYYGHNLDGLWDMLSTVDSETHIVFKNRHQLMELLGDYGEKILHIFMNAAEANEKIVVSFLD